MGERLRRQENMKVLARLSLENIRRAFFTAAVCAGLIPVLLVINIISLGDQTVGSILTGMFIVCEILDVIFAGVAFFAMKNRDDELGPAVLSIRSC